MPMDDTAMTDALGSIRDAEDVAQLLAATMCALGLRGIKAGFFLAPLTKYARVESALINIGLPRVWERQYRARLHLVDPLPAVSLERSNVFRWPEDIEHAKLTRQQTRYLQIAARYGLARGIGVACYGPQARSGFLGAVWSLDTAPTDADLFAVHQIGQMSFQRYCHLVHDDFDVPLLSNREREVLGWMCRGKSNPEMATILGLSRSSIDSYIRRIFAKLDVSDRTAACSRAYSLGIVASEAWERLVQRAPAQDEDES